MKLHRITATGAFLLLSHLVFAQFADKDPHAYKIYGSEGVEISFDDAVARMSKADVVLFGELHDHPVLHWLQLRTAIALADKKDLVMGGEMWESDNQVIMDEYIAGRVNDKRFEADARLWTNYKTDYKPLLTVAKERGFDFVATNVPRRYAGFVSQYGLDTLLSFPDESKKFMAPLPMPFHMDIPGYSEMLGMMHGGGMGSGMNPQNFAKAQALKDATMAHRILKYRKSGTVFLHFNGDFHSADYGGIFWYLKEYDPEVSALVIKVYSEDTLTYNKDWKGAGDILIVVADDFTRTH